MLNSNEANVFFSSVNINGVWLIVMDGDRKTARKHKYGESKTTGIVTATVIHVTSNLAFRKFQANRF